MRAAPEGTPATLQDHGLCSVCVSFQHREGPSYWGGATSTSSEGLGEGGAGLSAEPTSSEASIQMLPSHAHGSCFPSQGKDLSSLTDLP